MYSTIPMHETEDQALLSVTGTTIQFLRSIDSQDVEIPWSHRLPIVWSPDSSKLLLGGAFPDPSQDMYVLLDVKTNATTDLKVPNSRYLPTNSWTASFSSDGRYVVTRGDTARGGIAVMALHDATTGNLTEEFLIPMDYPNHRTDLVAFVPVPPNVDMTRAEQIMVSTEVGSPTSDDYNNRLYFYEVIEWDPNDPDDPNRPPDDQSDGAGALATGLLVMLPALAALAL